MALSRRLDGRSKKLSFELFPERFGQPLSCLDFIQNSWIIEHVNENRNAVEWLQLKQIENDFFHELQFVCQRLQDMKRRKMEYRILLVIVVAAVLLPVLYLAAVDFTK